MSDAIEEKLVTMFGAEELPRAREVLSRYGARPKEKEVERVKLAILQLSHGDLSRLIRMVDAAKDDYEDVLEWADTAEDDD